jgi:hypothetical protein
MRTTLKGPTTAVDTQRALQREALHELDDGQVVMRHLAGEAQAFGALVDRYQTRLLNFVNRTIGDRERAEDLVQEVFIRVFRHLHRFDQTKKFYVDLHDRVEPGEERAAQPQPQSAGAVPDDQEKLGSRSSAAAVRGHHRAS